MPKREWGWAPRVKITGDKDVRRALRRVERQAKRSIIIGAMKDAMKPVLTRAQSTVAVDTGATRQHLQMRVKGEEKGRMNVYVGLWKLKYAGFQEYGVPSQRRPPDNALLDTYHAEKARAAANVMRDIKAGIEREASRG
jgi:hypothetical protein